MTTKVTPGRVLLVTVSPGTNLGQDHAPALVTGVSKDGLVDLLVFLRDGRSWPVAGLTVYASRDELDELAEEKPDEVSAHAAYWPSVAPAEAEFTPKKAAAKTAGS